VVAQYIARRCVDVTRSPDAVSLQSNSLRLTHSVTQCLRCFDAVGWAAGRASGLYKTEWWGAGVVICLERDADLHTAQLMPRPLTVSCFSKIQIVFTFLVPAYPGSPADKGPLNGCACVTHSLRHPHSVAPCRRYKIHLLNDRRALL